MLVHVADHWEALAEAAQARRIQLGLRQSDLEGRGGPSTGTVRNLEQAARKSYAKRTLTQLEVALEWPPGTVADLLAGTRSPHDVHVSHPTPEMLRREAERMRRVNSAPQQPDTIAQEQRAGALDAIARAEREVRELRTSQLVGLPVVLSVERVLRQAWEALADNHEVTEG